MESTYLDNNATTRPAPEVIEAVQGALERWWANPSSVHRAGQEARRQVELAREEVGWLIGCKPGELVFTSGGTESINQALRGSCAAQRDRHIIVTDRLEHVAVRETAETMARRSVEVIWMPLNSRGLIDLEQAESIIVAKSSQIALVSMQWANNETGAIQPVMELGEICRSHGVRFHVDATQWVGKMPTDASAMPIDLMTFSAHKFHGIKGTGCLFVRRGVRIAAEIIGGPQERERRGGTENTPGIIGMGVAARLARKWLAQQTLEDNDETAPTSNIADRERLRDRLEHAIVESVEGARVNQGDVDRVWTTTNIAFSRLEAEPILMLLSERGVCCSAGAACSSGSLDPSPVLLAMGIPPELAHGSVRFSISRYTTVEEVDRAVEIVKAVIARLQRSTAPV